MESHPLTPPRPTGHQWKSAGEGPTGTPRAVRREEVARKKEHKSHNTVTTAQPPTHRDHPEQKRPAGVPRHRNQWLPPKPATGPDRNSEGPPSGPKEAERWSLSDGYPKCAYKKLYVTEELVKKRKLSETRPRTVRPKENTGQPADQGSRTRGRPPGRAPPEPDGIQRGHRVAPKKPKGGAFRTANPINPWIE